RVRQAVVCKAEEKPFRPLPGGDEPRPRGLLKRRIPAPVSCRSRASVSAKRTKKKRVVRWVQAATGWVAALLSWENPCNCNSAVVALAVDRAADATGAFIWERSAKRPVNMDGHTGLYCLHFNKRRRHGGHRKRVR